MFFGRVETVASGEGGSLPPADPSTQLPLDIQYLKAVDWLVERRVVNSSWQKGLRVAQAKLEEALKADRPPVAGVDAVLPGDRTQEGTTYFECAKVLAMLKEAGMDEKSFLGAFTNSHTARWAEVVKKYEAGNVFLVDTAQYLVQQTSYELPALKKEVGRAEREQAELLRRQADFVSMAEASRVRYAQACAKKQMRECAREDLRAELRKSLSQLRPLYDRVARLAQQPTLVQACAAYKAFPSSRNQLIDDLIELQGFFAQSAAELKAGGAVSALPLELQLDQAEVEARLGAVNGVLSILEDEHTKHLWLLGTSDQYLERQAKQLEQMLDSSDKMRDRADELQFRKVELASTIRETRDKYDAVVGTIQKAKGEFEQALSTHFGGRRVNLMGDINSI